MARYQGFPGFQDVALRRRDVEPLLVAEDRAGELAAIVGAADRRVRRNTGGAQVVMFLDAAVGSPPPGFALARTGSGPPGPRQFR